MKSEIRNPRAAIPDSPLFCPAIWRDDHFQLLDETLLPQDTTYLSVRCVADAIMAVRDMKTRAYGQVITFLYSVVLAARGGGLDLATTESLRASLLSLAGEFTAVRPTFGFSGIAELLLQRCQDGAQADDTGSWLEGKVHDFAREIDYARRHRARQAAELLPNPCCLLTHCNISGELVVVADRCRELGKTLRVVATETRPYLQGSRLTAWEVSSAGIDVTLIPDNAVAQVMAEGDVNAVLVGADRVARNGDVINKVGTYPLALMAREYHVPMIALVQDPGSLASGNAVEIEERPVAELFDLAQDSISLSGLAGRYPAFDVTPARLFTHLVGFREALTPSDFAHAHGTTTKKTSPPAVAATRKFRLLFGIPTDDSYDRIQQEVQSGRCQAVLVPEMRPELFGATQVAQELVRRGVPTTLISDNMAGIFFYREEVDQLELCTERSANNRIIARSGGWLMTSLAKLHGITIKHIPAGPPTMDAQDRDIRTFLGHPVSPEGVTIYHGREESVPL